jgi:hypothetical protein
MKTEVPIVRIEQAGPIEKGPVPWSRTPGYRAPLRYILADGTTQDGVERASRKRDVTEALDRLPARPEHPTFAVFRDGQFVGTSEHVWIGAGSDGTELTRRWQEACEAYESTRIGVPGGSDA